MTCHRFVGVGAATCPPEVKSAMIDWWGPILYEFYGATETGAVTFATPRDAITKPGTVGRAIEGASIVAKDASGRTPPPGVPRTADRRTDHVWCLAARTHRAKTLANRRASAFLDRPVRTARRLTGPVNRVSCII